MDTNTKIEKIFENAKENFIKMRKNINAQTNSYDFEKDFRNEIFKLAHNLFQEMVGSDKVNKNERLKQMTSFGEITMKKSHPLAQSPSGFKISPYLQEQMCRAGTNMTFEEASENLNELLSIETNAKQIERLCHYYGEVLNTVDWKQACSDAIQLRIPFKKPVYLLIDGSMLLTRDKEQPWKEVKLCRTFEDADRIKQISKKRNLITNSHYVSHLGGHEEFFDKVSEAIPPNRSLVFIADGAKWIWNWIEENYPSSIQILDFYHCKEHLYSFAKEYFATENEADKWVLECIEKLETEQVDNMLDNLKELTTTNKKVEKIKLNLLTYLTNNKKRINYGYFIKEGLLIGSGAIESANREVIQKRMKLSGQRWTVKGAVQMLNMRTCYKSKMQYLVKNLILDYKNCA